MNANRLLHLIGEIDDELIEAADVENAAVAAEIIKKKRTRKALTAIAACVMLAASAGIVRRQHDRITNHFIEDSETYKVSINGARMIAFRTIDHALIESVQNYILDNGYNSSRLAFCFQNSRYTSDPEYVHNHVLDQYQPEPLTYPSYSFKSQEYLYYVTESYYVDENYSIMIGYLALNEKGEIVESKYLKTAEECAAFSISRTDFEAMDKAREYLGEDVRFNRCTRMLCYFDDETKYCFKLQYLSDAYTIETIFIDGNTLEIIFP